MTLSMRQIVKAVAIAVFTLSNLASPRKREDTYLSAYMNSHGINGLPLGVVYGEPAPVPTPGGEYGPPTPQYGAPAPQYGPPVPNYGPPGYGDNGYSYGAPYAAPDSALLPMSVNLSLLFKILLKVLIFKMIIKFIAVICLLFILPKLGALKGEARMLSENTKPVVDNKAELTQFVLDAISGAPVVCSKEDGTGCRLRRLLAAVDTYNSLPRLFSMYMKEYTKTIPADTKQQKSVSSRQTSRANALV